MAPHVTSRSEETEPEDQALQGVRALERGALEHTANGGRQEFARSGLDRLNLAQKHEV